MAWATGSMALASGSDDSLSAGNDCRGVGHRGPHGGGGSGATCERCGVPGAQSASTPWEPSCATHYPICLDAMEPNCAWWVSSWFWGAILDEFLTATLFYEGFLDGIAYTLAQSSSSCSKLVVLQVLVLVLVTVNFCTFDVFNNQRWLLKTLHPFICYVLCPYSDIH
uniref:Uncharacterized protein n=1 Tax=Arundo donax TaxID=35708 RepID=A0A0A8XUU7_ARUDO